MELTIRSTCFSMRAVPAGFRVELVIVIDSLDA